MLSAFHACGWCGLFALYLNRSLLNRGFLILETMLAMIAVFHLWTYSRDLYWSEKAVIVQGANIIADIPAPQNEEGEDGDGLS